MKDAINEKAKNLFQTWTKNMIHYSLSAGLGQFFMNAPEISRFYQLGNFIFPLWDAHNEASKKVAESLGYQCLGAYPAYEWKGTFDQ